MSTLIQQAQAGHPGAIAHLMNIHLHTRHIHARVKANQDSLFIQLEAQRPLKKQAYIRYVYRGIRQLNLAGARNLLICHKLTDGLGYAWAVKLKLTLPEPEPRATSVNPLAAAPPSTPPAPTSTPQVPGKIHRLSKRRSVIPALVLGGSAIAILGYRFFSHLPQDDLRAHPSTPSNATPEPAPEPFSVAMTQAHQAYAQHQTAQTRSEWHQTIAAWQDAIQLLDVVPRYHPERAISEEKTALYQKIIASIAKNHLSTGGMIPLQTITGGLTPKSVVHSGKGLFFAQNMMYSHTITVYDRNYGLVKTIPDRITLTDFGYPEYPGTQQGSPVEVAFSHGGDVAWVSNYKMYGPGFNTSASDDCSPSPHHSPSFVYRIDTETLAITDAIRVGVVPKYIAATPDDRYVLVSNWCTWDVSVIDTATKKEVQRVPLGRYPRGIVVDPTSETAYVAVMGSYDIALVNLKDFSVDWWRGVGHSPRHLVLDPWGQFLYATLNGEGRVAKIDPLTGRAIAKISTGQAPRSMAISGNGQFLYVVNYFSNTVSKVRTQDMQVIQTLPVRPQPIGITYDSETNQVWVASYSGSLMVFQD